MRITDGLPSSIGDSTHLFLELCLVLCRGVSPTAAPSRRVVVRPGFTGDIHRQGPRQPPGRRRCASTSPTASALAVAGKLRGIPDVVVSLCAYGAHVFCTRSRAGERWRRTTSLRWIWRPGMR
jgi:hypothetical protein